MQKNNFFLKLLGKSLSLLLVSSLAFAGGQVTTTQLPSYKHGQLEAMQTEVVQTSMIAEITRRLQERFKSGKTQYKLSPEAISSIAVIGDKLPAVSTALQTIVAQETKDSKVIDVNQIRLEILATLGSFDISQLTSDPSLRDLVTLVTTTAPGKLNADSLVNLKMYFDVLRQGLTQQIPAASLLKYAKDILSNGDGILFEIEEIDAASRRRDGVDEIFYARNQTRTILLGDYKNGEGETKPLEVRMSRVSADALTKKAKELALELIEKTLSPEGRTQIRQENMQTLESELSASSEQATRFLNNNKILDRNSKQYIAINDTQLKSLQNIKDLSYLLQSMGHEVGKSTIRERWHGKLSAAPNPGYVKRKLTSAVKPKKDRLALLSHRQGITSVDNVLLSNSKTLKESGVQIITTLHEMSGYLQDLKMKVALGKLVDDEIARVVEEFHLNGRFEDEKAVISYVGQKLRNRLNAGLSQASAMELIGEAMAKQLDTIYFVREDIANVRNGMPIFTTLEMIKNTNSTLEMAVGTNKAVRATQEAGLKQLRVEVARANDMIIEINTTAYFSAETIKETADFIISEKARMEIEASKSFIAMGRLNSAAIEAQNLVSRSVGGTMDGADCTSELENIAKTKL